MRRVSALRYGFAAGREAVALTQQSSMVLGRYRQGFATGCEARAMLSKRITLLSTSPLGYGFAAGCEARALPRRSCGLLLRAAPLGRALPLRESQNRVSFRSVPLSHPKESILVAHRFLISQESPVLYITIVTKDRLPVFRTDH